MRERPENRPAACITSSTCSATRLPEPLLLRMYEPGMAPGMQGGARCGASGWARGCLTGEARGDEIATRWRLFSGAANFDDASHPPRAGGFRATRAREICLPARRLFAVSGLLDARRTRARRTKRDRWAPSPTGDLSPPGDRASPPPALRLRGTRSSRRCRRTLCSRVLSPGSPSAAGLPGSAAVRAPPSPDTALWRRVRAAPASAARATRAGTGTGARSLPRSFARAAAAADPPECTAPGAPWT